MKTKSSAKKRFKLTGSGKIKRKHAFKSHILTKKATDQKRRLTKSGLVDASDEANIKKPEEEVQVDNFDVHGYPCSQHPYNPMFDVQKQLPVYTKTPKSKSQFCAGYYIICFEKGWRKAYCPKMITLSRYNYKGPLKTKLEMQQVLNDAVKQFQDSN